MVKITMQFFGGRGGASGAAGSVKEDTMQMSETKHKANALRAKYFEYTAKDGKVTKGLSGNTAAQGGTYKAAYDEKVAEYRRMPVSKLEKMKAQIESDRNHNYDKFTRAAASRSGSIISETASQDQELKRLNQVLRSKKA